MSFFSNLEPPSGELVLPLKIAAALLFLFSLAMPGFICAPGSVDGGNMSGFRILLTGWMGIFLMQFAWFANVFWVFALFCPPSKKGWAYAMAGFLIGLQSCMIDVIPWDEGGVKKTIVSHLGVGFYLWEISFLIMAYISWGYRK